MADEDIRDFLIALSAAGVKHLVVGAYALGAHGYVRSTKALQDQADLAWLLAERARRRG